MRTAFLWPRRAPTVFRQAESTAMATVSKSTNDSLSVGQWVNSGEVESKADLYFAQRLAAASADYKSVAFTIFALGFGVATVVWLALGILIEHWLIMGGLPSWARWAWFATGGAAIAMALWRWIVPLVRYRVNLVYAAHTIEREHPGLHNDLVNAVLVKAHPEGSVPRIVRSLEHRAAKRLSDLPNDEVVDRTTAVRLTYCLAMLVALSCVYELVAPKSLLVSGARLLAPWLSLAAPSRVRIEPVQLRWRMPDEAADKQVDGDRGGAVADNDDRRRLKIDAGLATLVRGRQLLVTTSIRGLRKAERPVITVTPIGDHPASVVDGPGKSWQVEMQPSKTGTGTAARYSALLPDQMRGLDCSVEMVIRAGDTRSESIRIAVVDSPSLLVREVRYDYPPYTGRESETVHWQGDLRGVEGTRVRIVAESNRPLESAGIDFDCDDKKDVPLTVGASDLARASGSFELRMNGERTAAKHASYRLLFQPQGSSLVGKEPMRPEKMEHRIEVTADLVPEVSMEEPRESPLRVPPASPVTLRVRAMDPDFGLARVSLETRLNGGEVQREVVLLGSQKPGVPSAGFTGVFNGVTQLVPEQFGAKAGSVLEYRAVAVDTLPKTPNVSYTPWQSLRIDAAAPPRVAEEKPPQARSPEAGQSEPPPSGANPDAAEEGKQVDAGPKAKDDADQNPADQTQPDQPDQQQKDQQRGGSQGEPQDGQESGNADGKKQGGKQPAPGENKESKEEPGKGAQPGQGAQQEQGQGLGDQGQRSGGKQAGEKQAAGKDQKQSPAPQPKGDKPDGKQAAGTKQSDGKKSDGKNGAGKQALRESIAADGTNDGKAMERILEHRRQTDGAQKDGAQKDGAQKDSADGGDKSGSSGPKSGAGQKPGDGQKSKPGAGSDGAGEPADSGGQASPEKAGGEKAGGEKAGGKEGGQSSSVGSGGWSGGGKSVPADGPEKAGLPPSKEAQWDQQDLTHARNATDLALEHLQDEVDSGRTGVLDQLGWTRDQARAFLNRWHSMQQMAESADSSERADFDQAVRSLGLRPGGVRSSRDIPADPKGGQAEGRRSRPPSEYREQFRAYTQGTTGE